MTDGKHLMCIHCIDSTRSYVTYCVYQTCSFPTITLANSVSTWEVHLGVSLCLRNVQTFFIYLGEPHCTNTYTMSVVDGIFRYGLCIWFYVLFQCR